MFLVCLICQRSSYIFIIRATFPTKFRTTSTWGTTNHMIARVTDLLAISATVMTDHGILFQPFPWLSILQRFRHHSFCACQTEVCRSLATITWSKFTSSASPIWWAFYQTWAKTWNYSVANVPPSITIWPASQVTLVHHRNSGSFS